MVRRGQEIIGGSIRLRYGVRIGTAVFIKSVVLKLFCLNILSGFPVFDKSRTNCRGSFSLYEFTL